MGENISQYGKFSEGILTFQLKDINHIFIK